MALPQTFDDMIIVPRSRSDRPNCKLVWVNMSCPVASRLIAVLSLNMLKPEAKVLLCEAGTRGTHVTVVWPCGHVAKGPGTLAYTIMHGDVEGQKKRGRPRHTWLADIRKRTGHSIINIIRAAEKRENWRKRVMTSKCPNGRQTTGITEPNRTHGSQRCA